MIYDSTNKKCVCAPPAEYNPSTGICSCSLPKVIEKVKVDNYT